MAASDREQSNSDSFDKFDEELDVKPKIVSSQHFLQLQFNPVVHGSYSYCLLCIDSQPNSNDPFQTCSGGCGTMLHRSCMSRGAMAPLGEESSENEYLCSDCNDGVSRCFLCGYHGIPLSNRAIPPEMSKSICISTKLWNEGRPDSDRLVRCFSKNCSRRYHPQCLLKKKYARFNTVEATRVRCPQHMCHTCELDCEVPFVRWGHGHHLMRCVLCPAAYHTGQWCVPPGSLELTPLHLVCPRHLTDTKSPIYERISQIWATRTTSLQSLADVYQPENVQWCFICAEDDSDNSLIACDSCPASYHAACINLDKAPSGSYTCDSCALFQSPRFGSLVWSKVLPELDWWPSEVLRPLTTEDDLPPAPGLFLVRLLARNTTHYISRKACFFFEEDDGEGSLAKRESEETEQDPQTERQFQQACREADAMYTAWKARKDFLIMKIPTNVLEVTEEKKVKKTVKKKCEPQPLPPAVKPPDTNNCSSEISSSSATAKRQPMKRRSSSSTSVADQPIKALKIVRNGFQASLAAGECFRCGGLGENLLLCNKEKCGKTYHLQCLHLDRLPQTKWLCPWHHCDTCGIESTIHCIECPVSYCTVHWPEKICAVPNGHIVCTSHEDLFSALAVSTRVLTCRSDLEDVMNGGHNMDLELHHKEEEKEEEGEQLEQDMVDNQQQCSTSSDGDVVADGLTS